MIDESTSNSHRRWTEFSWRRLFTGLIAGSVLFGFVCLTFISYQGWTGRGGSSSVTSSISMRYWTLLNQRQAEDYAATSQRQIHAKFRPKSYSLRNLSFEKIRADPSARFDLRGSDVIVFLHIQKTAGTTFERFLVKNLDIPTPCRCTKGRKRCKCTRPEERTLPKNVIGYGDSAGDTLASDATTTGEYDDDDGSNYQDSLDQFITDGSRISQDGKRRNGRHNPRRKKNESERLWLFSRYSTGWSCGLHADWTELVVSNCVDNVLDRKERVQRKRRYFHTTFLREPISRYISEFRHVQRGATWSGSYHVCNGRTPTPQELPMCFDPEVGWEDVTLKEFMDCPYNLANNRQTRMLADLTLVSCYNRSALDPAERATIMLASAKRNLASMAFFGLQDLMPESQYLFEQTFRLRFKRAMVNQNFSKSADTPFSTRNRVRAEQLNGLDVSLYAFARQLFLQRFDQVKASDKDFEANFPSN